MSNYTQEIIQALSEESLHGFEILDPYEFIREYEQSFDYLIAIQ